MSFKKDNAWLAALLGVVLGLLLALTGATIRHHGQKATAYRDWAKLNLILEQVEKNYVDTVDVRKVTDAAVAAGLAALDPHSIYLPPVELEASEVDLAGNFDGIGIQFNVPNDTAVVIEAIPGGPSEKAGIMKGDRLLKVDTTDIAGVHFPQDSMVARMKGPSGSKVRITISRDGEEIPLEITRGKIPVHSVDASFMVDDTTGYIRLSKFSRTTYEEVTLASMNLLSKGMKRLVFDLRDNTGGYFDQALSLGNMFLGKGDEIVYLQGRKRKRQDYKADGKGILAGIPVSVLINESTASSSEIFAGAIQDNDRGVIVGRRSFGKGLVQEPIYFTDGSGVRITVARFYTPSGRCIQKPYSDDYDYDIVHRYEDGEMFDADRIHVDSTDAYKTVGGRTVYGGGGIIPDVFVPMDTTRATKFYISCNKKATQMRFAAAVFDQYKGQLAEIDNFPDLEKFMDRIGVESRFLSYAASHDNIRPAAGEWEETKKYLMPQVKALVGRYSKLGENAFYEFYLATDQMFKVAMAASSTVSEL